MKVTLAEWRRINAAIDRAAKALAAADEVVVELALQHAKVDNDKEAEMLIKLSTRLSESGPSGLTYLTLPQQEWTGGDSSDPENFTVREPNLVHMGKRFPREQVEADRMARDSLKQ